ncbi:hypothetical protein [Dactylosporangium matsuzakiense]|uniref:hypothetical protein n=1 Tax=Dactylosporangium matsuzakiense TaxID=53360 RepID=UPI0021C3CDC6|nr:hypothetical protein [Dactylosporangium matsuzakiense]UWZ42263.1 hypothetical protein Dmats_32425 [Dactylosporangium matsuzakiense]
MISNARPRRSNAAKKLLSYRTHGRPIIVDGLTPALLNSGSTSSQNNDSPSTGTPSINTRPTPRLIRPAPRTHRKRPLDAARAAASQVAQRVLRANATVIAAPATAARRSAAAGPRRSVGSRPNSPDSRPITARGGAASQTSLDPPAECHVVEQQCGVEAGEAVVRGVGSIPADDWCGHDVFSWGD